MWLQREKLLRNCLKWCQTTRNLETWREEEVSLPDFCSLSAWRYRLEVTLATTSIAHLNLWWKCNCIVGNVGPRQERVAYLSYTLCSPLNWNCEAVSGIRSAVLVSSTSGTHSVNLLHNPHSYNSQKSNSFQMESSLASLKRTKTNCRALRRKESLIENSSVCV